MDERVVREKAGKECGEEDEDGGKDDGCDETDHKDAPEGASCFLYVARADFVAGQRRDRHAHDGLADAGKGNQRLKHIINGGVVFSEADQHGVDQDIAALNGNSVDDVGRADGKNLFDQLKIGRKNALKRNFERAVVPENRIAQRQHTGVAADDIRKTRADQLHFENTYEDKRRDDLDDIHDDCADERHARFARRSKDGQKRVVRHETRKRQRYHAEIRKTLFEEGFVRAGHQKAHEGFGHNQQNNRHENGYNGRQKNGVLHDFARLLPVALTCVQRRQNGRAGRDNAEKRRNAGNHLIARAGGGQRACRNLSEDR